MDEYVRRVRVLDPTEFEFEFAVPAAPKLEDDD
jgi:hypothetical protein